MSYSHGLPKRKWLAFIGTTSLYLQIERHTSTCWLIVISRSSLSHWSLYGLGCGLVSKFNSDTNMELATLVQLPPSTIKEHNFPLIEHLVWKIFSLWVCSRGYMWLPSNLLTISKLPSNASSSISSSYSPSLVDDSLVISLFSFLSIVLLVRHSNAMCPLPKHLKHLMSLVLVLEVDLLGDFPCGEVTTGPIKDPPSFLGLSLQFGLWKLQEFLLAAPVLFSCCLTCITLCNWSSNSTYSYNSKTSLISWFSPLKKWAIVASLSSCMLDLIISISISL